MKGGLSLFSRNNKLRWPEQKCFKVLQFGSEIKVGKQSMEAFPSLAVPKGEGEEAEEEEGSVPEDEIGCCK